MQKSSTGNGPASDDGADAQPNSSATNRKGKQDEKKTKTGKKPDWVTVYRCFHCGKHGHNLPRCRQCAQAYYCDSDCQRKHWRKHKPVCRAAVAALARPAPAAPGARAGPTRPPPPGTPACACASAFAGIRRYNSRPGSTENIGAACGRACRSESIERS